MPLEKVDKTIEAKREYYRRWRKNNPDKYQAIQQRFWLRKAEQLNAETRAAAAADPGQQKPGQEE